MTKGDKSAGIATFAVLRQSAGMSGIALFTTFVTFAQKWLSWRLVRDRTPGREQAGQDPGRGRAVTDTSGTN